MCSLLLLLLVSAFAVCLLRRKGGRERGREEGKKGARMKAMLGDGRVRGAIPEHDTDKTEMQRGGRTPRSFSLAIMSTVPANTASTVACTLDGQ